MNCHEVDYEIHGDDLQMVEIELDEVDEAEIEKADGIEVIEAEPKKRFRKKN